MQEGIPGKGTSSGDVILLHLKVIEDRLFPFNLANPYLRFRDSYGFPSIGEGWSR
jgi:hypothetical protein